MNDAVLLLGIDTCGPSGSVALGRVSAGVVEILGQIELEGRSYSSTLVAAVSDLLSQSGVALRDLGGIAVVNGPGSFTGVRVGVSAAKGLADGAGIPVLAISRLEVLAAKAQVIAAALDAHRQEVFLRVAEADASCREILAGETELASIRPAPAQVAVCDDAAAMLLQASWPETERIRTAAPTAADALALCGPRMARGESVDGSLLDGHYLRRSDAEIFGEPAGAKR